ncbi:MAG: dihydrolipoamide acetyltransferase family protein [Candidatus Latescibacterota bacterium]|jgi:pyruvate dehydrogenase E2 component (dihydrolipoamide acetyltransferase)
MATEVVMPKLGLTMETGIIGAWLVEEGAHVVKGQPLLEIITDKVTMEVEAQVDGQLLKILVPADTEVAVSEVIGLLGSEGEDVGQYAAAQNPPSATSPPSTGHEPPVIAPAAPPASVVAGMQGRKHRASPKARKIAAESGVEIARVEGTGAGGRVVSSDVLAFSVSSEKALASPSVAVVHTPVAMGELTMAERVAAERLTASYQEIPHIHISMDVSAVWLGQFRQGYSLEGKSVSYNDLIVKATARALIDFPRVNSLYQDGGYRPFHEAHIGIAVAAPSGLVVPVIRGAEQKNIEQIAAESAQFVDRARQGKLKIDDMTNGTFTISNLGMFGVSQFTAIINPPQVAILAVGAIEKRVVVVQGDAFAVRPQMTLTLAADHRVVDGALAARFLKRLKEILETPGLLG